MRIELKKLDCLFIGLLVLVGVICLCMLFLWPKSAGEQLVITVDGEVYGTYRMQEEQEISVERDGHVVNVVVIADGRAHMKEADCPDHLCIRQGEISKRGETLICLPNKVVVEAQSGGEGTYDSIVR